MSDRNLHSFTPVLGRLQVAPHLALCAVLPSAIASVDNGMVPLVNLVLLELERKRFGC